MKKLSMLYPRATATRRVQDMGGMWKFQFDPQGIGGAEGWPDGLPGPMQMPVPASFADMFTDKVSREYAGDFWYETEVFIPGEWRDLEVSIRFGCATHRATVYVNGVEVAFHEGGFLPFDARITEVAKFDAPNRVVVRVNNELREDCLPVGRTAILPDGRKMAKPYFDFYNYSGLNRLVALVATPKEHIVDFTVNHHILGSDAEVEYWVETTGERPVEITVYDERGGQVARCEGASGVIAIEDVRLWNVRDAYLYRFVIRILDGETVVDEYYEDIGVRTVEIDGQDILLNGKPVYLKGFGKHEDSDIIGRGFSLGVIKRDFELMKWASANSFRTAHYPYCEEIYQMADREGFLVIDEAPAVGLMASTLNFFDAAGGKQTKFFEKETTPALLENHLTQLAELIARDKNYACVIAWSLLNEPETTDDSALPYLEKVFEAAHALDVQRRPRTYTSIMMAQPDRCKCYQLCDFICLNRYYGWYVLGGNEIGMAEMAFRREMDAWYEKEPDKPFVFTEYGADTSAAEHKLPSVMWSQEYQTEYLEMCHRVFDSYDCVRGEQVWAFADFQTGEGTMRLDGNKKGIFTRQRQPKASAYLLKARWEALPTGYKSKV